MKLEQQVISLQQAKRLKELGIDQESLFYFYEANINGIESVPIVNKMNWHYGTWESAENVDNCLEGNVTNQCYSAFGVSELGVMLGWYIEKVTFHNGGYLIHEKGLPDDAFFYYKNSETEIRADLLIYLIEKGIILISDCNARLIGK